MPGPTQNSAPADLDRVLKELALINQRLSALSKQMLETQKALAVLQNPRIAIADTLRPPSAKAAVNATGVKAHE